MDDHTHEHGEGLEGLEHARDREEDGHDGGVVGVVLGDKTVIQVSIVNTDSLIRVYKLHSLLSYFGTKPSHTRGVRMPQTESHGLCSTDNNYNFDPLFNLINLTNCSI